MLRAEFVDTCKFVLASRMPGETARGRRRHVAVAVRDAAAAAAASVLRREACLSFWAASGPKRSTSASADSRRFFLPTPNTKAHCP